MTWSTSRLSRVVRINEGLVDPTLPSNSEKLLIAPNHVESGTGRLLSRETVSEQGASSGKCEVRAGQVVYSKIRPKLMKATIAPEDCLCSADMYALEPTAEVDSTFLMYALLARPFTDFAVDASMRVAMPKVNRESLAEFSLDHPDLTGQRIIAAYLDTETARIDELIAEQQGLMADLKERRQAVIARMVDWPEWQPVGRRYSVVLGKMLDGARAARHDDVELPYLRAANIQDEALQLDSVNSMPFTADERLKLDLRRNDLLVVEGGAGVANVQVLSEDMPGWGFQKTLNRVRARRSEANTRFLAYVIRSLRDSGFIDIVCNKSTIPHLTAEKLSALRVPMPDPQHQERVVVRLDEETGRIDDLTRECRDLIALLKERRSALITAAVTGKIDVRGQ